MEPKNLTPTGRRTAAAVNRAITAKANRQAGQISYEQLTALKLNSENISSRVDSGFLTPRSERPRPSRRSALAAGRDSTRKRRDYLSERVYSVGSGPQTLDAKRWAAVLSAPGGQGRLSHVSACWLLGLDAPRDGHLHVLRLGERWTAPKGVTAHRTSKLPKRDLITVGGIPSTTLPRSLIDAAVDVSAQVLEDLLDSAVGLGLYDGNAILRVMADRPTYAGVQPLTQAVASLDATSGTFRSIFERRTKRLIDRSTIIGAPVVNVLLDGYRPDLLLPGTSAIIECDGRDYHRSPAQIIADDKREEILRARGYAFLRLRWADVMYDEERTLARIEQFVLANAAPPVPRG